MAGWLEPFEEAVIVAEASDAIEPAVAVKLIVLVPVATRTLAGTLSALGTELVSVIGVPSLTFWLIVTVHVVDAFDRSEVPAH